MSVPELTRAELRRYSRPLLLAEWADAGAQEKLSLYLKCHINIVYRKISGRKLTSP